MPYADEDLGVHKAKRRVVALDSGETQVILQNIAAGAFFDSGPLSAVGFTHFMGQLSVDTPAPTTLSIRVIARILGALGTGGLFCLGEEFPVAIITTAVGTNRYPFYWGEARGLVAGALGSGATWCFSPTFFIRIRNTGAAVANLVTIESLVFM